MDLTGWPVWSEWETAGAVADTAQTALETRISIGKSSKPFGEVSADEADDQGAKLKGLAGFGPTMRARPVGMAWTELAKLMREADAATVSELDPGVVNDYARKLWVVHSSESLMQDPKEPKGGA